MLRLGSPRGRLRLRRPRTRRGRLAAAAAGAAAALVLLWVALDVWLFAFPASDRPQHADAVIVLAGDRTPRLQRGLALIRAGVARTLVISDGHDPRWPAANALCAHGGQGFRVVCFRPSPYSTQGEARGFARLARENGWRSVVVATSAFHVTRARMLFRRCFAGRVEAVGAHASLHRMRFNLVTEVGKLLVQLTVDRSC